MKRLTYVWSTIGLLILFAVFLMFQNYFTQGITMGAVKG